MLFPGDAVTTQNYSYDGSGRLVERARPGGEQVRFTSWDSRGRPTGGTITHGSGVTEAITISYADSTRTALWSNGEEHVFDADGNPVRETLVYGSFVSTRTYMIFESAKVCRDA